MESAGIGSWEWDLDARTMSGDSPAAGDVRVPGRLAAGRPGPPTRAGSSPRTGRGSPVRSPPRSETEGSSTPRSTASCARTASMRWLAARGRPLYDARAAPYGWWARPTTPPTGTRRGGACRGEAALMALIARASDLLASSLEAEDAVRSFARLVVPVLADWSVVSLVGDDGRLADVDWWHHDPDKRELTAPGSRCTGSRAATRSAGSLRRAPQRRAVRRQRERPRLRARRRCAPRRPSSAVTELGPAVGRGVPAR